MTAEEIKAWVEKETGRDVECGVPLAECGLDSLDFMELMIKAEEHYGIVTDESDIKKCVTIEDMVMLFNERKSRAPCGCVD
jgi:acyl carrier protein